MDFADISNLTKDELLDLRSKASSALEVFRANQILKARKRVVEFAHELADELGLPVSEVLKLRAEIGTKTAYQPVNPAIYANPANPQETWSGRGRPPAWFKMAEMAGVDRESLRIHRTDQHVPAITPMTGSAAANM